MSQSSIIFGALFVGFLVFITMKGELPAYAAVFKGTASTGNSVTSPITSTAVTAIGTASSAGPAALAAATGGAGPALALFGSNLYNNAKSMLTGQ